MNTELEAYYGLPNEVKFCKKCVISNQRPSSTVEFKNEKGEKKKVINFNEDGICSACVYHDEKETGIDWDDRDGKLRVLLDKFRSSDGSYDVIVPGSGGKDSAFTAHILKYKYGMNPLTVTWAPHLYTDIGWKNMQEWMHTGGLDNILYTPNGILHKEMTKNAFHNLLHPFQPFIVGQRIIGPAMAKRFGVKLVMYGENQAEYGNSIEENTNPIMDMDFFSSDDALSMKFGGVSMKEYIDMGHYTKDDFAPYIAPEKQDLIDAGIEVHYLGYYLNWDPQECYYYSVDNTGFQANPVRTEGTYSKYSSIDDKIDPFHYLTTLIKFGIGRCTYDAAQEVRNGKITREEAVYLVKKYDTEFPGIYFKEFLEYIDSTEDEFWKTINKHRSPHIWKQVDGEWMLRHTVAGDGVDDYIEWEIDNAYFNSEDYKLNNRIALEVYNKGYDEISKKYTHIKPDNIELVLKLSRNIFQKLSGNGIDLGGGVGSVSSVVALSDLVDNIICLEITRNCVIKCHNTVISKILGSRSKKVTSIIGDFDKLKLEDNSLDFAISWDAMHHSNNIVKTLKEIRRVLKKDGFFLIVDRGHNNDTSQKEIDRMLNVQYSKEFLIDNYFSKDKILSRKDNGEHEYRYNEWNNFFSLSGFVIEEALIVRERCEKNTNFNNDASIKEVFVDFELGGFEKQKVMYLLKKK